ncbi:site-specific integrase [Hyphomonas oceanitis]|uniref:site-specific integrase n=1 Tax=Hyphomonas oceanitis TaxID=81033 RepID=UPI00300124FB
MTYVYTRSGGLYEVRYPIPEDVRSYFPKKDGIGFKRQVTVSLGTRDPAKANRIAPSKFAEIESKFAVLRNAVGSEHFSAFCQHVFDMEIEDDALRRLDAEVPRHIRDDDLPLLRKTLENRDVDALEASVGWMVDYYLENAAHVAAVVPHHTELRTALLNAAADVMHDVYFQISATAKESRFIPKPKAAQLQSRSDPQVSAGDNLPLSKEGRLSLERYWDVHEHTKQNSSSPVRPHTLSRRRTAWKELTELLGSTKPLFKVTKSDIWSYRDALTAAPARAGSIIALRHLTFPERIHEMKASPNLYKSLDLNSVGDRLRQINAVFKLAVRRGHLANNPADGVSEAKPDKSPYRSAYSESELSVIFTSPPYDRAWRVEEQNDEFWVPLLELFQGTRASELYTRMEDVHENESVPHIRLVEYDERSMKNAASERLVPIHPQLIELGFLEYCRRARSKGDLLFPDWVFRDDQKPSEGAGRRRFNRHIKKLLPDRVHPADSHTFRNTFETALSSADGIPERVALRLTGRSTGAGNYVDDLPFPVLEEAIAKIKFGGLSLKHLL